ncbi:MAG: Fe-S cluster assembly protein SufD [Micromonosporaceae bacterium]
MTQSVQEAVEAAPVTAVASHLHPEGSFDLDAHPVPTGLEEIWRFTPLKRLRGLLDAAPLDGSDFVVDVRLDPSVTAESVPSDHPAKGSSGYVPTDRISARAWQAADKALVVTVPAETVAEQPSVITLRGTGNTTAAAGHLVIEAKPYSSATVVVRFEGSATLAENVEYVVGDGAQLTVVVVHGWDRDAVYATHHHARIGRDARLREVVATIGGDLVRVSSSVEYTGPGGSVELFGLYFADADQHLEHRLFVDHNAPSTRSRVDYRGALQGRGAHTVWIGDVLIRKVAEAIDTYESNRNLVLTDGCRADSVPNLEIETGEITGAGHASATGRFDDEQLFYLRSRGIPYEEARKLVVRGFFAELLARVPVPELVDELSATIDERLAKADA